MPDRRAAAAAALLLVSLLAAEVFFAFRPSPSYWAFSNGADLPLLLRAAWLALLPAAAALALYAARRRHGEPGISPTLLRAGGALGALATIIAILFYLFRSSGHFMGDGYLVLTFLERDADPLQYRAGWGTLVVHRVFFRALRALGATNGEELSFAILSSAAGGAAVFAAVRFARRIAGALRPDRPAPAAALLIALLLTTGAMQLFFGYVETYTPAQLYILLFVAGGSAALLSGGNRAAAAAAFPAAVFFHTGVVIALPALFALLLEGRRERLARLLLRLVHLSPILLFLLPPTLSQLDAFEAPLRWTAPPEALYYSLLSPEHLFYMFNLFALVAPIPMAILVATIRGRRAADEPPGLPAEGFLRTAALSLLAFAVVIRPGLGPRDWDLFCFYAPAIALWAGTRLLPILPTRTLAPSAILAWGAGLFLLLPWVGGNAFPSVAADRAVRFTINDPLHWNGDKPRAVGFAGILWKKGGREQAMRLYREATRRRPDSRRAHANVGIELWGHKEYAEAAVHLEEAVRLDPTIPATRYYLGSCRFHLREGDWGESQFRFVLAHDPDEPSAALDLGRLLYVRKEWAEARHWLRVALGALPDDARLHFWIGQANFHLGDREAAEKHLRRAYALDPDSEMFRGGDTGAEP
ncbi:MAG: tetratricopeptide repeat protein [Candidatus Eisenbacteria bacterium]|nr:tetratricopeptide repeat protein [Candidatus Eisenbacteria bacterium]